MKTRHAVFLFVIGICLDIVGALLKILHLTGADELLTIGAAFQVVGTLLFLYKLLTNPKIKEFLDW